MQSYSRSTTTTNGSYPCHLQAITTLSRIRPRTSSDVLVLTGSRASKRQREENHVRFRVVNAYRNLLTLGSSSDLPVLLVLVRIVTEKIGKLQVFLRAPLVLVKCKIDKSLNKNALLRRASLFCHSGDCSSSTRGWLGQVRDRVPSQICQDCSNNITMFFYHLFKLDYVICTILRLHLGLVLKCLPKTMSEDDRWSIYLGMCSLCWL
jgi:hypothetical protein